LLAFIRSRYGIAVRPCFRHISRMRSTMVPTVLVLAVLMIARQPLFAQVEAPMQEPRNGLTETTRALREDPKMQERMRDQQMQKVKDVYRDFVKEQKLSTQQTQRFYQLLTDYLVEGFIEDAEVMEKTTEKGPSTEPAPDLGTELMRQLHLLLGDTVVNRLHEYEKTGSERLILAQYRHELRMNDVAISDETAKSLFQIIGEEKARMPALAFDARGGEKGDPRRALEGDNAERYYEAEADLNRRVLSRAGSVLNEEQYAELAKFMGRHLAAEKAGIEALRRQ
jgi:hypothetical protein